MNKICVYTCITGNYDNLIEVQNIEDGIDYLCYTNNRKIKSKTWSVKYISDNTLTNAELNRKIKILGDKELKKYDATVYIDGNFTIVGSIKKMLEEKAILKKYDLVGFKHSVRNSINEEMLACLMYNKAKIENIAKLYDFYNREKFSDNNGLIEASILIRNFNNNKLNECMKLWFDMYINYAHRDQLSFQYAAWKTGLKYNLLDMSVWNNEYTKSVEHKVANHIDADVFFKNQGIFLADKSKSISFDIEENKIVGKITASFEYDEIVLKFKTDYDLVLFNKKCDFDIKYENCIQSGDKLLFNSIPIIILRVKNKKNLTLSLIGYLDKNKNIYLECYRKEICINNENYDKLKKDFDRLNDELTQIKKDNTQLLEINNKLKSKNDEIQRNYYEII